MRHRVPGPPTHTIAKALVNKQVKQVHAQANMALIDESIANLVSLEASLYRDDFAEFVRAAFHVVEPSERFVDGWHIDAVCEHLQACATGQIKRLVINIPPGYAKSTICSVMFPAWVWTRYAKSEEGKVTQGPSARLLFTSYSDSFAERDSRKTRNLLQSEWYQRRWPLGVIGDRSMEFENDKGGLRFASGISGGVTGKHFHYALTDDPLKAQDAHSRAERERVIRFWSETLSTRMFPGGVRIVVMQRLHQRDLTGYVLEEGGYEHVMLPERYEAKRATVTVLGKPDKRKLNDELLWPQRYGEEDNKLRARELGPFGAAGQLQQRPAPAEGGILQRAWWKRFAWADLPAEGFVVDVWDMTFDEGETHDYVCGMKLLCVGPDMYVLKRMRGQWSFMDSQTHVKTLAHDQRWPADSVLVENKANGPAIVSSLRRVVQGLLLVEPRGSKIERAHASAPAIHAGNVWLPSNEDWVDNAKDGFIVECGDFPNAANDDQVDCITHAIMWWGDNYASQAMDLDGGERENPATID